MTNRTDLQHVLDLTEQNIRALILQDAQLRLNDQLFLTLCGTVQALSERLDLIEEYMRLRLDALQRDRD